MTKPKLDKATIKTLNDGDELQAMVASPGWLIAKQRFTELVVQLGDIFSLKDETPDAVFRQLAARQIAIELIMSWMKEIEGRSKQHQTNSESYALLRREAYIIRNEEEVR